MASAGARAMATESTPLLRNGSGLADDRAAVPRFGHNAPQASCRQLHEEDEVLKACNVFANVYADSLLLCRALWGATEGGTAVT